MQRSAWRPVGLVILVSCLVVAVPAAFGCLPSKLTPVQQAAQQAWIEEHWFVRGLFAGTSSSQPASRRASAAVPKAACGPDDKPETGLQGQVPWPDRLSGRAVEGYTCNLRLVGSFDEVSFASFDNYEDCVYFSNNPGATTDGATVVLDMSNPAKPVKTDTLTARAMRNNGESLKVNQARGLLVSAHYNFINEDEEKTRTLAVYDISQDCRRPKLLADVVMPTAVGHEGCFSPDGMVYYMGDSTQMITPIDLSDPRNPKQLSEPWLIPVHGCSISEDGTRGYFARVSGAASGPGGLMVVDTSQAAARRENASPKGISYYDTPDGKVQQSTFPISYGGHPYLLDFSELIDVGRGGASECDDADAVSNFAYPRIFDMGDERNPKEVSKLLLEVDLPENCAAVAGDKTMLKAGIEPGDNFWPFLSSIFTYDSHYCRPDRLKDPTLAACSSFLAGLRVYDIRDPHHPKELAYYNPGTVSATDPTVDMALAPPVIRRDVGQIWYVSRLHGLQVLQFRDGIWPFADSDRCPGSYDYMADQYDRGYRACLAARRKTVAPKPNRLVSLPRATKCRTGGRLQVRLGQPTTGALERVRIYVDGRRVRDLRGRRIRAAITVRTPGRGRYTVRVVVRTTTGKTITTRRSYRACTRERI